MADTAPGKKICVLIPAFRENGRIGPVVREVLRHVADVIVVDDGSGDGTGDEAEAAGAVVLRHASNIGKGVALDTGFSHVIDQGFDAVITMDGDGQHSPDDLASFVEAFVATGADIVVGDRMSNASGMPLVRRLTNRFMSRLLSRKMGQPVPDTQCGFRLYSREVISTTKVESQRYDAESEILIRAADRGFRVDSVPVRVIYRDEISTISPTRDTVRFFRMLLRLERNRGGKSEMGEPGDKKLSDRLPLLLLRGSVGGTLMGLANLVPGISGGTMLLAAGIYPRFINAIAEVTTFRFRTASLAVLGSVVAAAAVAILLLAGTVKELVVGHRWIMYSLFIGLTLGGVPIVWRLIKGATRSVAIGAVSGFIVMAALAVLQQRQIGSAAGGGAAGIAMMFVAGIAGASAMILPGVSGGYLLLVLGQYIPILSAIDTFKTALQAGDMGTVVGVGLRVGLPVGVGVALGVIGVSNVLRALLRRYPKATLGVLLGLLLGAVVGLWPYQEGVKPGIGDVIKGVVVTEETIDEIDPDDYPTAYFHPSGTQVAGSLGVILLGFALTCGLSRFGGGKDD